MLSYLLFVHSVWGCEKGIIGRPRRGWENNIKLILKKKICKLNMYFERVVKNSKLGKKCLQRSSSSVQGYNSAE
jgi:hypothetical protein